MLLDIQPFLDLLMGMLLLTFTQVTFSYMCKYIEKCYILKFFISEWNVSEN